MKILFDDEKDDFIICAKKFELKQIMNALNTRYMIMEAGGERDSILGLIEQIGDAIDS